MNINKSIISIALLVIVVLFTGCSTDGYWDQAPMDADTKFSFDQKEQTYSVLGTETLTEIKVPLTRSKVAGVETLAIEATFSNPALSGPEAVTFEDGSNTAIYTIAVGNIAVGTPYTATLKFETDKQAVSGNSSTKINLSKAYSWVPAGKAMFYSGWSSTVENGAISGDGVKVDVERAEGGDGLYRLKSPYYFSEKAAGTSGVTLKEGSHIQFIVKASNGEAVGFPRTTQAIGEASAEDGNYYFAYTVGKNNCSFTNVGNTYLINGLIGYDEGGTTVSLGWYETVILVWSEGYPW